MTEDSDQGPIYWCPTCDEMFLTERAQRIHHKKKHGESLVEESICETCGEPFEHYGDRRFCSAQCYTEYGRLDGKRPTEGD